MGVVGGKEAKGGDSTIEDGQYETIGRTPHGRKMDLSTDMIGCAEKPKLTWPDPARSTQSSLTDLEIRVDHPTRAGWAGSPPSPR